VLLAAAVLGMLLVRGGAEVLGPDCRLRVQGEQVGLTAEQARDATTLAAVTYRDGRTQQALAGALPAVLDRDEGGGLTPEQASALLRAPGAAPDRLPLARALLGYGQDRLVCAAEPDDVDREAEGPGGLTPRADAAKDEVLAALGDLPLGGFAPGGVSSGHIEGSAHYEGRAVDVFFRPVTDRNRRHGWTAAQYLQARADRLDLAVLIFDRRIWSAERSDQGWRDYRHPSGDTTNPVLNHLGHVHLDVLRGT
jgi:hypothetical protein